MHDHRSRDFTGVHDKRLSGTITYAALFSIYAIFSAYLVIEKPTKITQVAEWVVFSDRACLIFALFFDAHIAIQNASPFIVAIGYIGCNVYSSDDWRFRYFRLKEKTKICSD